MIPNYYDCLFGYNSVKSNDGRRYKIRAFVPKRVECLRKYSVIVHLILNSRSNVRRTLNLY